MNDFIAHILVVDDDDGIRTLLKRYLSEKNFWFQLQTVPKMQIKKF